MALGYREAPQLLTALSHFTVKPSPGQHIFINITSSYHSCADSQLHLLHHQTVNLSDEHPNVIIKTVCDVVEVVTCLSCSFLTLIISPSPLLEFLDFF